MSISQLVKQLNRYDPYHICFWNGIRAVSALIGLLTVNFIYGIHNPYFYFFYIPITCISIEILGENPYERAKLYIISVFWSALAVFVFGLSATHRGLELLTIFGFSSLTYFFFIHHYKHALVSAATILSLGGYSLNYHFANVDIYQALNHFGLTLFAGMIVVSILFFFPRQVYWKIWHRILTKNLIQGLNFLSSPAPRQACMFLFQSFSTQLQYARMLRKPTKTLLKATILNHELLESIVVMQNYSTYSTSQITSLRQNLQTLIDVLIAKRPCPLTAIDTLTPLDRQIWQLAKEWNKLCAIYFSTP